MKNKSDLQDTAKDKLNLQEEVTIIELPDVEDIPGQEHVKVPRFNEFADTTISSDGEEGTAVFSQDNIGSDVSAEERVLLEEAATKSPGDEEEADAKQIALDRTDNEGVTLNEGNLLGDRFGEDLDLPESEGEDDEA